MKRRTLKLTAAALAAAAALALSACSSVGTTAKSSGDASASAASGPFDYTDARGEKVHLDEVPTTVVAQSSVAASLWDAGYHVAGVYGELTPVDGKLSYQAGSIDLDKVTVLGKTYGEFDTEKYGLMNPQLLVDYSFDGKSLWYVPAEQSKQILALAPSVAVPGTYKDTTTAIETFVDLAGKLGANTKSAALEAEKADYDKALEQISAIAADSGLKVVIMSGDKDSLYVVDPQNLSEATTLKDKGLDIIAPAKHTTDTFQQYSWEQASEFADADVILFDARIYDSFKSDLAKIPTWTSLPAVKAGQVYGWYAAAPYSYKSYAKIFQDLADELKSAKKLG
ncbi:ABC transporter substrate-binding protein [Gryllotalpicola ginsengisoli]|uniref:ABC transporter substrate-binding protein n=1 Tax=Gryllotalpicola ginsengisoli TaxID=444608 RepID=UPI0003B6C54D|nr:ABC transporter substrate-binding protein [Gryllotalpicola ginsengisoli]